MIAILLILGILLIVYSVSPHGDGVQSSYTQAHGVRRAARVISETTGTAKQPNSALTVRLGEPVNGHDTTTVHFHGTTAYSPGALVAIVVDPQDPGYAEFPGAPYTSGGDWEFFLGTGLAVLVMTLGLGVVFPRMLRSRRQPRLLAELTSAPERDRA